MAYQTANDRRAQNSAMLYQCLRKSITSDLHAKVSTDQTRYYLTIPGPTPNDPVTKRRDSICFLKAIIDETYTNTLNNAAVARSNLATLGQYMKTLDDSNIVEFNAYVKINVQELAAAGETTSDLLVNLFNGYREARINPSATSSLGLRLIGSFAASPLLMTALLSWSHLQLLSRSYERGIMVTSG